MKKVTFRAVPPMVAYKDVLMMAGNRWNPIAGVIVPLNTVPDAPPSRNTSVPTLVEFT